MPKVIAIPPGETIRELADAQGFSLEGFAAAMGLDMADAHALLTGYMPLTVALAMRLEGVLGAPARFWLALEARYRWKEARLWR